MSSIKSYGNATEKASSPEEQAVKINEVRKIIGPVAEKFPVLCSDASISRYLRARNWNTKKAVKMLKETLKWRLQFKPEKIRWDDVAMEAKTGKVYRANFVDKNGRTVLVMRPGYQNTNGIEGQMKHLVYCLENAIMTSNEEQMIWLVDFQGWTMASISVKSTKETIRVLQNHYPERLALAILFNPPKIFESFWTMVKPFIEPKTYKKVKFAYSNNPESQKMMKELFDMDKLDSAFGGTNSSGFNHESYGQWMKEDEKKIEDLVNSAASPPIPASLILESEKSGSQDPMQDTSASDEGERSPEVEGVDEETEGLSRSCSAVVTGNIGEVAEDPKRSLVTT
ncbi:hypothetical protein K2173_025518 [Erythroxylum novogranatense]|uniref:CRAL-TRIO domain-containing protein n=1 Tax=Erythroxylum novogranatense TaxID=1862640 RepID=A0AAV8TAC5_9ROSI|nr:hypothetical protein K2173_025518 [Erythroxylum novogranatense]